MSLLIKSAVFVSFVLLSSLSGSDYRLDTEVVEINKLSLIPLPGKQIVLETSLFVEGPIVNMRGEAVWTEQSRSLPYCPCFYWSAETGTIEIDIDEELNQLGHAKRKFRDVKPPAYKYFPFKLDNQGTVFLNIHFYIKDKMPHPYPSERTLEKKIGVWNKKFGFKLLDIPDVDSVFQFQVSDNVIFVNGVNRLGHEKLVVLRPVDGRWPWEPAPEIVEAPVKQPPETTPWDTLPFGKHGARLHIIQQLMKSTKNAEEKKTIMLMAEGEIAHILDLLQYDLKRAQVLIKKAVTEGKVDLEAEQLQAETKKHIVALQDYLKTLPKANKCRVDAIYLPSKDWVPNP